MFRKRYRWLLLRYGPNSFIYIHTYFICHKLSIVEYKYYVDSNGGLPDKLVLIMLAAHYYIYNKYCNYLAYLNAENTTNCLVLTTKFAVECCFFNYSVINITSVSMG